MATKKKVSDHQIMAIIIIFGKGPWQSIPYMTGEEKKKGIKKGEDVDAGENTEKEIIEFCNYIAHL